jgi:chemotaxis response regulator CheB
MRGEDSDKETVVERLRRKWDAMQNHLDERGRRVWAASEAEALGHGGVTIVHEVTGMSRSAITQGIAEMAHPQDAAPPDRARMFGGGRKKNQ